MGMRGILVLVSKDDLQRLLGRPDEVRELIDFAHHPDSTPEYILSLIEKTKKSFIPGLREQVIASYERDLEAIKKRIASGTPEPTSISLDKSWDFVSKFLASQDADLSEAVLGCEQQEIGPEFGFGPAHYLTPQQVSSLAQRFQNLSQEQFRKAYKAGDFVNVQNHGDYAQNPEDTEELEYLSSMLSNLKSFYINASSKEAGVIAAIL